MVQPQRPFPGRQVPLGSDQLLQFACLIAEKITEKISGDANQADPSVIFVDRYSEDGKLEKQQTTLPQLLGELNDRLGDLTDVIEDLIEETTNAYAEKRPKRRKKKSRVTSR